jgi:hypothetical protein
MLIGIAVTYINLYIPGKVGRCMSASEARNNMVPRNYLINTNLFDATLHRWSGKVILLEFSYYRRLVNP